MEVKAEATLAEQWNGSSWATVSSPNPAGAQNSSLQSVACTQVTNCWAVGVWTTSPEPGTEIEHVLIERWNGKDWTIVAS
jgi:hypothetical protein